MAPRPLATYLSRLIWLSLLPLLALAVWNAVDRVRSDRLETQEMAARRSSNHAATIDNFLEAHILPLTMLASSPLADDPARWPELYAEALAFHVATGSHVIFADAGRQMRFNTRVAYGTPLPLLPGAGKGRTAAAAALATGQPAVGDIVQGPVANEPLVAVAVPGLRAAEVRHLLLATVTTMELQQRVDQIAMPPGWALSVRDSAGELIAQKAPPGFDSARDVDARWRFVTPSRLAPWEIAVEVPRALQRQSLIESVAVLVAAIALATLAGLLGGRRFAGRLVRQMASLSDAAPGAPEAPDRAAIEIVELEAVRRKLDTERSGLRESERRYSELLGRVELISMMLDRQARVTFCNDYLLRLTGWRREEVLGCDWFEKFALPGDDEPRRTHRALLEDRPAAWHQESEIITRAGARRLIRWNNSVLRSLAGEVIGTASIGEDVTERTRAEAALRENSALLRIAGGLARFGGWSVDIAEGRVHWSDEVAAIHEMPPGYSPRVAEGIEFYAPEWRGRIGEVYGRCVRDGTPYDEELEIVTANGRRVWVRTIGEAVRGESGEVVKVQGAFQDITARKEAEGRLVESERRYRALFEHMTGGFVLFEVVQDERGTPTDLVIVAANRGFEAATGLPLRELVGHRLTQVLPGIEHDAADWIGKYGSVALTGVPRQFEERSELLGIDYFVSAYQAGPKLCAVAFSDITERKRAEALVRRNAEELRLLSARVTESEERERTSLAKELHDQVGQNLTALSINLGIIEKQLPEELAGRLGARLHDSLSLLQNTSERVRDVMAELRPPLLDE